MSEEDRKCFGCEKEGEYPVIRIMKIVGAGWTWPKTVYYCKEHFKELIKSKIKKGENIPAIESLNDIFSGHEETVDLEKILEELENEIIDYTISFLFKLYYF